MNRPHILPLPSHSIGHSAGSSHVPTSHVVAANARWAEAMSSVPGERAGGYAIHFRPQAELVEIRLITPVHDKARGPDHFAGAADPEMREFLTRQYSSMTAQEKAAALHHELVHDQAPYHGPADGHQFTSATADNIHL